MRRTVRGVRGLGFRELLSGESAGVDMEDEMASTISGHSSGLASMDLGGLDP